eukprot:7378493-Prymnesium_polylepis.1
MHVFVDKTARRPCPQALKFSAMRMRMMTAYPVTQDQDDARPTQDDGKSQDRDDGSRSAQTAQPQDQDAVDGQTPRRGRVLQSSRC